MTISWQRVVVVIAALAVLTGCASLPTSGPVSTAQPEIPTEYGVDVLAGGPQAGQSPSEIVDGFLQAARFGLSDDFNVAGSYLTESARTQWSPLDRVYLYSAASDLEIALRDDGGVSVSVAPIAMIDGAGHYVPMDDTATYTVDFSLVRVAEDWRIAELDDAVLIDDLTFEQTYVAVPLSFPSLDNASLVPDLRWFPHQNRVEYTVRELLEGPSGWLAPGVATAFPPGTTLGGDGVSLDENVVHVDLSSEVGALSTEERSLMLAQLRASLAALPEVSIVEVTVEGEPLDVADAREFLVPQSVNSPLMLQDNVLVRWTGSELAVIDDSPEFQDSSPRYPAVPYAESSAPPVVIADGDELRTVAPESGDAVTLLRGNDLTPPSYDRNDWIWTSDGESTGVLHAVDPNGTYVEIGTPWLAGREMLHVRVSSSGNRVVLVSRAAEGGAATLEVAVVLRDRAGRPLSLGDPFELESGLSSIADVTWVDATTVAVLGAESVDPGNRLYMVSIGGPVKSRPQLADAVSLTSSRNERSIMSATSDGRLFQRTGSGWRELVAGVRDPAFSG